MQMWGGASERSAESTHELAQEGVSDPGGPLPHADQIQRAFGRHDIGGVRAHVGRAAESATRGIGARAYAIGEQIAFAAAPDLRMAAHEAAHVVQQRSGVALAGNVGAAGDRYEQHADAVADRVVAGESAQALLDSHAGSGATTAVQRWGDPSVQRTQLSPMGFVVQGTRLRVERLWYEQWYRSHVQEGNGQILDALAVGPYPWIRNLTPEDRSAAVGHMVIAGRGPNGAIDFEQDDTQYVAVDHSLYVWIGMPPGTGFEWQFPQAGPRQPAAAAEPPPPPEPGHPPRGRPQPAQPVSTRLGRLLIQATQYPGDHMTRALCLQVLSALERGVGSPVVPAMRARLLDQMTMGNAQGRALAAIINYTRNDMVMLFGEAAWTQFEDRGGSAGTGDQDATSGTRVDPSIPQREQEFARRMLEEINGHRRRDGAGVALPELTAAMIAALHEIDQHPQRERILQQLRTGRSSGGQLDAVALRQVMNAIDMQAEYDRLGITPTGEARERHFPVPVTGRIVNNSDLLFTGRDAAFTFDVQSRDVPPLGPPAWCNVHWVVRQTTSTETSAPTLRSGHTSHRPFLDAPDRFTIAFEHTGTYEINALVDHDLYRPNHFTISVEVQTEAQRFQQMQDRSFSSSIWGETDPAHDRSDHTFQDASITDLYRTGRRYEGSMQTACEGQPIPGNLDALDQRIAQVQRYQETLAPHAAEREWATEYLRTLREARTTITAESSAGARLLFVQGAYLSRGDRASSQTLNVVANAILENNRWRVRIHDMTQAFDTRNSTFDYVEDTFERAAEHAFTELAKSYPRGMLSLRLEMLDTHTGLPTGRFVGWELECNSTWEAVRSVAYHPIVQTAVNIAGAAVSIFAPPLAAIVVPALIAYNGTQVVSDLIDLRDRGAATWQDYAMAGGQLALDLIPYVGEVSGLVRVGSTTFRVMHGLMIGGQAVLMTAQMSEQVASIRMGVVRQAAEMRADIEGRESANPSDPELPRLRAELQRLEQQGRDAWQSQITQAAIQQGLMLMSTHLMQEIQQHRTAQIDQARTRLMDAAGTMGSERRVTHADLADLRRVFGVEVRQGSGGASGSGVHIEYRVSALGGITDVRLSVGHEATLAMVMAHEPTLAAMRRYEGVTGSLNNLLERVQAYVRGGGHIPPGTRAFEARFELEKLPPIIAQMHRELATRPLDDTARARIEDQISNLTAQLAEHASAFDDLAPGLGYVAARDTESGALAAPQEGEGTMAVHAGTQGTTVTAPTDIPAPAGRTAARHAELAQRRGGAGTGVTSPSTWSARDEAAFRFGSGVRDALPPDYLWTISDGRPVIRRREVVEGGAPQRQLSATAAAELASDAQLARPGTPEGDALRDRLFPRTGGEPELARPRTDAAAIHDPSYSPTTGEAGRMRALATERGRQMGIRDRLQGEVERLRGQMHLEEDDLSGARWEQTIRRLREEAGGDAATLAQIAELERQRQALSDARLAVNRASEQIGNRMAADFMAQRHGSAQRVYGTIERPGRPGEFDFVYVELGPDGRTVTGVYLVEAKGGSSETGFASVDGRPREQGSPTYARHIAEQMLPSAAPGSPLHQALSAIVDAESTVPVRYLLVEARLDAQGMPRPGQISEFDLTPRPPTPPPSASGTPPATTQ